MNRRQLLKLGGATLASVGLSGRLYAAPTTGPRFLLVFLRGGYDSANLLIPYSSSYYYEARPTLAIAGPDPASNTSALALNGDWALAPAVRDSIGAMYLQRQVAFVPFAGTDDLSRSHFETQDSIELGQPIGGRAIIARGFWGASQAPWLVLRMATHRLPSPMPCRSLSKARRRCPICRSRMSASRPSTTGRRAFSAACMPAIIWSRR